MLEELLQGLAALARAFSPTATVDAPVLPCQRDETPRVWVLAPENTCPGRQELLRAVIEGGVPVRDTFQWHVLAGDAELSDPTLQSPVLVGGRPGEVMVEVLCVRDGHRLEPAQHTIRVHPCAPLPKLIHFIWAGGSRIMPARPQFETVAAWAAAHRRDGFTTRIWVDGATNPKVAQKYEEAYGEQLGALRIELHDVTELEGWEAIAGVVRYEIDKLWPNYGSSSDILRYAILYEQGGAYFDSDVQPGATPLGRCLLFGQPVPVKFLSNDNSQNSRSIGNDAFVCTPRHPLMLRLLKTALGHYGRFDQGKWGNNARRYDEFDFKMSSTVERTGPWAVMRAFADEGLLVEMTEEMMVEDQYVNVKSGTVGDTRFINRLPVVNRLPAVAVTVSEEESNTLGWMKVPIKARDIEGQPLTLEGAALLAARSMRFEMEVMGMYRPVGQVSLMAMALREPLQGGRVLNSYEDQASLRVVWADDTKLPAGEDELRLAAALAEALDRIGAPSTAAVRAAFRAGNLNVVDRFRDEGSLLAAYRYPQEIFRILYEGCTS